MRGQIEQFVRQEVLYREALARGYDKDDPLVRRAMQQKMEFLGQAQAVQDTLTEQEIEAFYALRREQYRVPGAITFTHIYYNLDQRGSWCLFGYFNSNVTQIRVLWDPHPRRGTRVTENTPCGPFSFSKPTCRANPAFDYRLLLT